jgi:protein-disulfide isomerase
MKPLIRQGMVLLTGMVLGTGATLGAQSFHQHRQQHAQQQPEAPKTITTPLGLRGDPSLGSSQAPVTIVEFSDFQCPYCKRFHDQVLPSLKADYIDKGLVRFVHKDLPLPFHEFARDAAETARCSADQRQYWSTYRALFQGQECFACKGIKTLSENAGIPPNKLEICKKAGASRKAVNSNLSEAELQGIRATPSFVIGPSQGDKHTGLLVEGAMPWPQFKALVEEALKKSESS